MSDSDDISSSSADSEADLTHDEDEKFDARDGSNLDDAPAAADGRLRMRGSIDMGSDALYEGRVSTKSAIFGDDFGSDPEEGSDRPSMSSEGLGDEDDDDVEDDDDEVPSDSSDSGGSFLEEYESLRVEDAKIMSQTHERAQSDRAKGKAIAGQKRLWDRMLHVRILAQKLLNSSNKLPQPEARSHMEGRFENITEGYAKTKRRTEGVLDRLVAFQRKLHEATPGIGGVDGDGDGDASSQEGRPMNSEAWWATLSQCYSQLVPFVTRELDRWQRKTMVANVQKGANLRSFNQSISTQVKNLLEDPIRLARRTHIGKGEHHRVLCAFPAAPEASHRDPSEGADLGDEVDEPMDDAYDQETYEDTEFYRQLLKEFLESQNLGQMEGVPMKEAKKRKVVDRKASKGRKIRYHVHDKLVNFMVPDQIQMPDSANALFASLFACDVL